MLFYILNIFEKCYNEPKTLFEVAFEFQYPWYLPYLTVFDNEFKYHEHRWLDLGKNCICSKQIISDQKFNHILIEDRWKKAEIKTLDHLQSYIIVFQNFWHYNTKQSWWIISWIQLHKGNGIVKNIKYSDTKVFFLFFQGSHWQIPSKYTKNSLGCFMGLLENN